MIIIRLQGGLGNQMFQYAVGRYLAELNATQIKFDLLAFQKDPKNRKLMLDRFKINIVQATDSEISLFFNSGIKRYIEELLYGKFKTFHDKISPTFHPEFINLKGNILLDGYFQSEKYFESISNIISSDFEFQILSSPEIIKIANLIKSSNSVSIHFRRGDYVHNTQTKEFHGVCTNEYYSEAIRYISNKLFNVHFFIFSDDISWVKNNFEPGYSYTMVESNQNDEITDMYLMSICKHNIIANSSFSWWGAWLNKNSEKIVIGPKNWVNKNSQWFRKWKIDDSHVMPRSWIKI